MLCPPDGGLSANHIWSLIGPAQPLPGPSLAVPRQALLLLAGAWTTSTAEEAGGLFIQAQDPDVLSLGKRAQDERPLHEVLMP